MLDLRATDSLGNVVRMVFELMQDAAKMADTLRVGGFHDIQITLRNADAANPA